MGQRRGWWGERGLFSCLLLVIEVSLAGQLPDRTGQREFARSVGLVHILGREDRLRSEKRYDETVSMWGFGAPNIFDVFG